MVLENNYLIICLCWLQRRQKWCFFYCACFSQAGSLAPGAAALAATVKHSLNLQRQDWTCDMLLMSFTWSQWIPKLVVPSARDGWPAPWVCLCVQLGDTYQCKVAPSFFSRKWMLNFLFFFPVSFHKLGCSCMTEYSTGWKPLHQSFHSPADESLEMETVLVCMGSSKNTFNRAVVCMLLLQSYILSSISCTCYALVYH